MIHQDERRDWSVRIFPGEDEWLPHEAPDAATHTLEAPIPARVQDLFWTADVAVLVYLRGFRVYGITTWQLLYRRDQQEGESRGFWLDTCVELSSQLIMGNRLLRRVGGAWRCDPCSPAKTAVLMAAAACSPVCGVSARVVAGPQAPWGLFSYQLEVRVAGRSTQRTCIFHGSPAGHMPVVCRWLDGGRVVTFRPLNYWAYPRYRGGLMLVIRVD